MAARPDDPATPKHGTVTAFNEKLGVGYISSADEGDDDVYVVHAENIALPGYATLEAGQKVLFVAGEPADDVTTDGVEVPVTSVRPVDPGAAASQS